MKVVNKINDNAIPSTPNTKSQFSTKLNLTRHWNHSPFNVLSYKNVNFNETKNTHALTERLNQRTKSRLHVPKDNNKAPIKGEATKVVKILDAESI